MESDIEQAVSIIKSGGIVIFPTDTVYGIGVRADHALAVAKLYAAKQTPKNQPFPILVSSLSQVEKLAQVTPIAKKLIKKYWPGALTIILKEKVSGKKIGFRMPNHQITQALIAGADVPIIGTSANFHKMKTPTGVNELDPMIIKMANYLLRGDCTLRGESTVVDATVSPPRILRRGAIELEEFGDIKN